MNGQTNIQVTGWAGAVSLILIWLLSFFFPALFETAPIGLGVGMTTLITMLAGWVLKKDAGVQILLGPKPE